MPVIYQSETPLTALWKITESWQEMLELLINKDVFCSDVMKISSDRRKQEWLAARLLLQHLSGSETRIGYREDGAPFLSGSPLCISISHTKGYAAIILSKNKNPGIDMEYRSNRAWRLRERYMDENEWKRIISAAGDPAADIAADIAVICWCAKETAFKALGETGVDFSGHLRIEPFGFSQEGFLVLEERRTEKRRRFRINYRIADEYILTWKE
jgi:4'-phosphopantetheinyl transferase EntD